jgi:hypothetical protein
VNQVIRSTLLWLLVAVSWVSTAFLQAGESSREMKGNVAGQKLHELLQEPTGKVANPL